MDAMITVLHFVVCIFLVAVVLLQRGKGAQVGAVFGGGAGATMFGGRGAGNFLTKLTTGAAAIYMITSLSLSYLGITDAGTRLFEDGAIEETVAEESLFEELGTVPAEEPTAPAPAAEAPSEAGGEEASAALEAEPAAAETADPAAAVEQTADPAAALEPAVELPFGEEPAG